MLNNRMPINNKYAYMRISAELDRVQTRCKCRTISYYDIIAALETLEKRLGVPKKYLTGAVFQVDCNAQNFPSAYKYTPDSTIF